MNLSSHQLRIIFMDKQGLLSNLELLTTIQSNNHQFTAKQTKTSIPQLMKKFHQ